MLRQIATLFSCVLFSAAVLPAVSTCRADDAFLLPKDKIMWIGDSITAQNLYETYVMKVLKTLYPEAAISDVNYGVGGATAPTRFGGIPEAVDKEKPTLLTVMFGVNDTRWSTGDEQPKIAEYIGGLQKYADLARAKSLPLVLLRETHFSHNRDAGPFETGMDDLLLKLFAAQDKLAAEREIKTVDVYGAYTRELAKAWQVDPRYEFTPNVIHPTNLGHSAAAGEILKAFGAGLPLSTAGHRGNLHLDGQPAVQLSAAPQAVVIGNDDTLSIALRAENTLDRPLTGRLLAVVAGKKYDHPILLAARGSAEHTIELPASLLSKRWEVQPIYLAFLGAPQDNEPTVFAAGETPLYYSHLIPSGATPYTHDEKGWLDWEGRKASAVSINDVKVTVKPDELRAEFVWKDTTPVLAQPVPYKARLGEPVNTPLDMTSPFGQPCDAVELLLDLRDADASARYTSNMDSIPEGTARVGLYRIAEGGKTVSKLQVSPPALAGQFELNDLGGDRWAITRRGKTPECGIGFNMFVSDAVEYAPNKPTGAYLTTVLAVGTDWVDFLRVTAGQQGIFCRVGY